MRSGYPQTLDSFPTAIPTLSALGNSSSPYNICVTAGGHRCKDSSCVVRLCSGTARGGGGMIGVRLPTIGGSAEEVDKSGSAATQEDSTGFYGFLFDL